MRFVILGCPIETTIVADKRTEVLYVTGIVGEHTGNNLSITTLGIGVGIYLVAAAYLADSEIEQAHEGSHHCTISNRTGNPSKGADAPSKYTCRTKGCHYLLVNTFELFLGQIDSLLRTYHCCAISNLCLKLCLRKCLLHEKQLCIVCGGLRTVYLLLANHLNGVGGKRFYHLL